LRKARKRRIGLLLLKSSFNTISLSMIPMLNEMATGKEWVAGGQLTLEDPFDMWRFIQLYPSRILCSYSKSGCN